MARYDAYADPAPVFSQTRGWIISALTGSLVVHLGLFTFFYFKEVDSFSIVEDAPVREEITKRVKIVEAPPKKAEEVTTAKTDLVKTTPKKEIVLPKEQIKLDEISVAPQNKAVDTSKLFANEKPTMEMAKIETTLKPGNPDDILPKLDEKFFTERTGPKMAATLTGASGEGASNAVDIANKDAGAILDALNEGPASGPKTLSIPGNTTFGYDSDQLGGDGRTAMETIADVFKKFLGADLLTAHFTITGHTDSFGGKEYNYRLSHRRADTVKAWLVVNLGIPLENVATAGKGSDEPVAPITGTVEEQAQNRRVEIVIRRVKK